MEEIIKLLSAYYTALVEKGYMDQTGCGTTRFREETSYTRLFFIAAPDWGEPVNIHVDHEGITRLVYDGYYFWLARNDCTDNYWNWISYNNGKWQREHTNTSDTISVNDVLEMIRRSANEINLELKIKQPSEISIAARLLDDEIQYEI